MSGLLVKSTLIMRDNLEELNALGLAELPVILGGAALTRSYVERDLREVYDGRVFYGRDAFEGLHTMERLMELKRSGDDDPDFGRVPTGRALPKRSRGADEPRRPAGSFTRGLARQPGADPALPRLAGREGAEPRRHRRVRQRDGVVPQPVAVPAGARRERRRVQGPHPARCSASSWRTAKASGVLVPQVVYGYLPVNGEGDDLVVWTDESRVDRAVPVPLPPPAGRAVALHRRLLPAGQLGRGRLRRLPHRHDGSRRLGGDRPSCSRSTATRSTCCSTASASR